MAYVIQRESFGWGPMVALDSSRHLTVWFMINTLIKLYLFIYLFIRFTWRKTTKVTTDERCCVPLYSCKRCFCLSDTSLCYASDHTNNDFFSASTHAYLKSRDVLCRCATFCELTYLFFLYSPMSVTTPSRLKERSFAWTKVRKHAVHQDKHNVSNQQNISF